MIKKLFILTLLLAAPKVMALEGFDGYVSPESYAINEADMRDYMYIPPARKPNIDELDNTKFDTTINETETVTTTETVEQSKTVKVKNKKNKEKTYEDTLKYKVAKWWVDKRYEREEPHHGTKHEIKVNSSNKE